MFFFIVPVKLQQTSRSLILLSLKCLPSNTTKKSLMKTVKHRIEGPVCDGKRDVQLGRFILLNVPFSQQLPRPTSLFSLVLSVDR